MPVSLPKGRMYMTEQEALLILNAVPDLGARRIRKLLAHFGSAEEVLRADYEALRASAVVSSAMTENIIKFSKDKFLEDEYNFSQRQSITIITSIDKHYP